MCFLEGKFNLSKKKFNNLFYDNFSIFFNIVNVLNFIYVFIKVINVTLINLLSQLLLSVT